MFESLLAVVMPFLILLVFLLVVFAIAKFLEGQDRAAFKGLLAAAVLIGLALTLTGCSQSQENNYNFYAPTPPSPGPSATPGPSPSPRVGCVEIDRPLFIAASVSFSGPGTRPPNQAQPYPLGLENLATITVTPKSSQMPGNGDVPVEISGTDQRPGGRSPRWSIASGEDVLAIARSSTNADGYNADLVPLRRGLARIAVEVYPTCGTRSVVAGAWEVVVS